MFLTWQSRFFGLTRRSAFFIAICLCGDVMLFTWALRQGWIIWWLLSIAFLILVGILWPKVQMLKEKVNALAFKIKVYRNKSSNEEIITQTQATSLSTESIEMLVEFNSLTQLDERQEIFHSPIPIDERQEVLHSPIPIDERQEVFQSPIPIDERQEVFQSPIPIDERQEVFHSSIPIDEQSEDLRSPTLIDELIEQGFKEKYSENFEKAAYFFFRALSLDPIPDLAFYLIMDCYWLWYNLGERDKALTQLQIYIQKYLPQFNLELRHQFEVWMTKENLHNVE